MRSCVGFDQSWLGTNKQAHDNTEEKEKRKFINKIRSLVEICRHGHMGHWTSFKVKKGKNKMTKSKYPIKNCPLLKNSFLTWILIY